MHFQGEKRKRGEKNKKIKRGEKKQKRKERGKKNKKEEREGKYILPQFLSDPAFLNRIFSGEKACTLPTLLLQKIKTNMPIVYRPSSFKILRV